MNSIRIIDSHTGGEPTRLVMEGGPNLGEGALTERVQRFREQFDHFRSAIVSEPRGSDVLVGALLCKPHRADCQFGIIFFNNVGYLGMCGHGTIGVVESLAHAGVLRAGSVKIDTPVGVVDARLREDGQVDVTNVPSYRHARRVKLDLPNVREQVTGDVAWGGNWFFLVEDPQQRIALDNLDLLTQTSWHVRQAANAQGYPEVDHVELFGPPATPDAHSRNFVLCPGKAYDRSPCGTGTCAKVACLAADNKLAEGEPWIQESIVGSRFTVRYFWIDRAKGIIAPTITGAAHVTGEATLRLDPADPFCWGIRFK